MNARRTPWWVYVAAAVVGFVIGLLVTLADQSHPTGLLGAPWFVSGILLLLGFVVLYLAWQVHKYATTDPKKRAALKTFDVDKAVNTLVLAKALAVAGAILLGWYGGQLVMSVPHWEAAYFHDIAIECAVAAGASLIDMILGIVSEGLCMLPPSEGGEHPKMRTQNQGRGQQYAS